MFFSVSNKYILQFQGKEYVGHLNKSVPEKKFQPVQVCCANKCFEKVEISEQEKFFNHFWKSAGNYKCQNIILSSLMTLKNPNVLEDAQIKIVKWSYSFRLPSHDVSVCQKFLLQLLSISRERLVTVQNKIKNNESFDDNRGTHTNHVIRLTPEIKKIIHDHCLSVPHTESHYTREKSQLFYFEHPDLNLPTLYKLFLEYHTSVTGNTNPPIGESCYTKYFNHNLNFTFSKPRTDVCDFCYEKKKNPEENTQLLDHKKRIDAHKILKDKMITEKNVLALEFDFGQNLPLPKIPVSSQFYKRLLWLHIFNVNTFGPDKNSYMFFFIEGKFKKGPTTVCNFLYEAIQRELVTNCYNKIYLLSDGCGGQNKNYTVFAFLLLLAKKLQIEIQHLFPVRGHSYCSCDRMFGTYGKKKKNRESIKTDKDYFEIIEHARDPPFIIINDSDMTVRDYEPVLSKIKLPKNIRIRDAVKITFFPNGQTEVLYDYNETPQLYTITTDVEFDELMKAGPPLPTGISKEKIADVKSLLKFLTPTGQKFFNDVFAETTVKTPKETVIKKPIKAMEKEKE